jgi:hypothetical protein
MDRQREGKRKDDASSVTDAEEYRSRRFRWLQVTTELTNGTRPNCANGKPVIVLGSERECRRRINNARRPLFLSFSLVFHDCITRTSVGWHLVSSPKSGVDGQSVDRH